MSPGELLFERMPVFRQGGLPLKDKVSGAAAAGWGRNTGVELVVAVNRAPRFVRVPPRVGVNSSG